MNIAICFSDGPALILQRNSSRTTDEELQNLAQLIKEKGTDALRLHIGKVRQGPHQPCNLHWQSDGVARDCQQSADTIITIATDARPSVHSGFLQVKLDACGKSSSQIMAAAKIRFNKKRASTKSRAIATNTLSQQRPLQ